MDLNLIQGALPGGGKDNLNPVQSEGNLIPHRSIQNHKHSKELLPPPYIAFTNYVYNENFNSHWHSCLACVY